MKRRLDMTVELLEVTVDTIQERISTMNETLERIAKALEKLEENGITIHKNRLGKESDSNERFYAD
tara:strand:- start:194 stop:391 length:198 start_codon:yes stop_codon:yes gene_type:complete